MEKCEDNSVQVIPVVSKLATCNMYISKHFLAIEWTQRLSLSFKIFNSGLLHELFFRQMQNVCINLFKCYNLYFCQTAPFISNNVQFGYFRKFYISLAPRKHVACFKKFVQFIYILSIHLKMSRVNFAEISSTFREILSFIRNFEGTILQNKNN
jgi:hypothetical protein